MNLLAFSSRVLFYRTCSVIRKHNLTVEVDVVMIVLGVALCQFAELGVEVVVVACVFAEFVDGGEGVAA